jgi:hypothetical protein
MRILLLQSSDPRVYAGMLAVTAQANRLYAERQGLIYEGYIGIKRGAHPWHATFNRIPILQALAEAGEVDWVFYLDADAYVLDFTFDLKQFLATRGAAPFIAAAGSVGGKWDINAGIFFLNLRHPAGRRLVEAWHAQFMAQVTDTMLRDGVAPWSFAPNDQDLLQAVLKSDPDLLEATEIADFGFINATGAQFARQVLRAHHATLAERIAYAQREVAQAISLAALPPVPLAAPPTELGALLPFLLADWRSASFFMLLLAEKVETRSAMWLAHFPRAHCFGLTYEAGALPPSARASFWNLDDAAPDALADMTAYIPEPLLVVDEASPTALLQQLAFLTLFPCLAPGGYYVVKCRPYASGAYRPVSDIMSEHLAGVALAWQVGDPARHAQIAGAIGRIHVHRTGNATLLLAVERR